MKEKELERVLKALANKRRLAIINLLSNNKGMSVGDIASDIKLSFRATSKHLAILTAADILEKEQRSTRIFYSISKDSPDKTKQIVRTLLST